MDPYRVVTGWAAEGWGVYGARFVAGWRYWPGEVGLLVCHQGPVPGMRLPPGAGAVDILEVPEYAAFFERHGADPVACGRERRPGCHWKPQAAARGYNFRFDAVKWARQVFAIVHGALGAPARRTFWIDGDVETFAPVPLGVLDGLLPGPPAEALAKAGGVYTAYFGRRNYHPDIGVLGFRGDHGDHARFMAAWRELYLSGRVFGLEEWHSAWTFDHVRRELGVPGHDYNARGGRGACTDSVLGAFMVHHKGQRKLEIA